jgi:hypothetical protein
MSASTIENLRFRSIDKAQEEIAACLHTHRKAEKAYKGRGHQGSPSSSEDHIILVLVESKPEQRCEQGLCLEGSRLPLEISPRSLAVYQGKGENKGRRE